MAAAAVPEVVTMGRISVDLYPEQIGVPLAEVRSFAKGLGGSPTNVAVAAARLGRHSAVITKVGDDPFGPYCRAALRGFGVDPRWVGTDPDLRTPVAFCELFPPDDFPLLFYREPTAPDLCIEPRSSTSSALAVAPLVWTTGTGLSREPSRSATLAALDARAGEAGITVHDLDDRPMLWPDGESHAPWAREAVARATVVVGNQAEAAVAVGEGTPREQAERLLALGPRTSRSSSRARAACSGSPPGASPSRCRRSASTSSAAWAPVTRSAARCATRCCPAGSSSACCATPTRPARTSPPACCAPTRCRRPPRSRSC